MISTRVCNNCGNKFHFNLYKRTKKRKYCSRSCANKASADDLSKKRTGKGNPMYGKKPWNYQGGRKNNIEDYKSIGRTENGGRIFEHRKIIEDHIGRKLNKNEVVHHVDGNVENNSIDNLEVMTRAEHTLLHNTEFKKRGGVL